MTAWLVMLAMTAPPQYGWMQNRPAEREITRAIAPPAGWVRASVDVKSFGYWLRHLPLKPKGTSVMLHNGRLKGTQSVHYAVVDIDTGRANLQQCADAAIRLHSEFLWATGRADGGPSESSHLRSPDPAADSRENRHR